MQSPARMTRAVQSDMAAAALKVCILHKRTHKWGPPDERLWDAESFLMAVRPTAGRLDISWFTTADVYRV